MTLKILQKEINEKKEIQVGFAKEALIISETSNDWSNEGINNFLINLAAKTPDGDLIEIDYDKDNKDPVFKHVVELFTEFIKEYNKHVKL